MREIQLVCSRCNGVVVNGRSGEKAGSMPSPREPSSAAKQVDDVSAAGDVAECHGVPGVDRMRS
jgi:hypothetical protein